MNKSTVTKYLVGFAVFLAYFIVARQLENRVPAINKLTGGN